MPPQLKPGDDAYCDIVGKSSCRTRYYKVLYINHDHTATVRRTDTISPTIEIVALTRLMPTNKPSITTMLTEAAAVIAHEGPLRLLEDDEDLFSFYV